MKIDYGVSVGGVAGMAAMCADKEPSPFERINNAAGHVNELIARLEKLADQLVGPMPQLDKATGIVASTGLLLSLRDSADHISQQTNAGHEAIARIERLLP